MHAQVFKRPWGVLGLWLLALASAGLLLAMSDIALLRYAQRLQENNFRFHLAEAGKLLERNDLPGARARIDTALRLAPQEPEPYVSLGHFCFRTKNWAGAVNAYKEAIARGSADEGIRQNTIWAMIEQERFDEAAQFGREAIRHGFQGPLVPRYVAEAFYRAERFSESITYFETALEHYPNDLYLMEHLQRAYRESGRTQDAEAMAARIAETELAIIGAGV